MDHQYGTSDINFTEECKNKDNLNPNLCVATESNDFLSDETYAQYPSSTEKPTIQGELKQDNIQTLVNDLNSVKKINESLFEELEHFKAINKDFEDNCNQITSDSNQKVEKFEFLLETAHKSMQKNQEEIENLQKLLLETTKSSDEKLEALKEDFLWKTAKTDEKHGDMVLKLNAELDIEKSTVRSIRNEIDKIRMQCQKEITDMSQENVRLTESLLKEKDLAAKERIKNKDLTKEYERLKSLNYALEADMYRVENEKCGIIDSLQKDLEKEKQVLSSCQLEIEQLKQDKHLLETYYETKVKKSTKEMEMNVKQTEDKYAEKLSILQCELLAEHKSALSLAEELKQANCLLEKERTKRCTFENEVEMLRENSFESENLVKNLTEKVSVLEKCNLDLKESFGKSETEICRLNLVESNLRSEIELLQAKLAEMSEFYKKEISTMEESRLKLSESQVRQEAEISQKLDEIKSLKTRLSDENLRVLTERSAQGEHIFKLTSELESIKKSRDELFKDLENLKCMNLELENSSTKLSNECSEKVKSIERSLDTERETSQRQQNVIDQLRKRLTCLRTEKEMFEKQIAALQSEMQRITEGMNKQMVDAANKANKIHNEKISEISNQLNSERSFKDNLQKEMETLKMTMAEKEDLANEKKKDLQSLLDEERKLSQTLRNRIDEITKCSKEANDKIFIEKLEIENQLAVVIEEAKQSAITAASNHEEEMCSLRKELDALRSLATSRRVEAEDLRNKIESTTGKSPLEIYELESKMKNMLDQEKQATEFVKLQFADFRYRMEEEIKYLKTEKSRLTSKLCNSDKEIKELKKNITEFKNLRADLVTQKQMLEEETEGSKRIVEDLKLRLHNSKQDMIASYRELELERARSRRAEEEILHYMSKSKELEQGVINMKHKLGKMQAEIHNYGWMAQSYQSSSPTFERSVSTASEHLVQGKKGDLRLNSEKELQNSQTNEFVNKICEEAPMQLFKGQICEITDKNKSAAASAAGNKHKLDGTVEDFAVPRHRTRTNDYAVDFSAAPRTQRTNRRRNSFVEEFRKSAKPKSVKPKSSKVMQLTRVDFNETTSENKK